MLRSVHDRLAGFADPPRYVDVDILRDLTRDAQAAAGGLVARWPDSLSDAPEIQMLRGILEFLEAPDGARSKANETFVANELVRSRALFDRIEARPLTDEQRKAVVVDERSNLVVAAAGSGKTSVIVAKAGWLVRRGYRKPSDLLLLAFARDARNEMEERVRSRLGAATAQSVTVRTFHSLGMAIIGDAEGKRPALARTAENDRALFDLLKGIVADLLAGGALSETLLEWFQDQFAPYRSEHEFANWGAYWNYIRRNDIRSLKADEVKSYEECEIANFLYLNGIAYEYEAAYEHETATAEKRQYKPDFFLADHGIYIEHFGLDAEGNTAPFVDREKYIEEMEWKRQIHAERGTILVETFTRERAEGRLNSLWRHIWRWIPAIESAIFPDLNGTWEGSILTTWTDPKTGKSTSPIPATVWIKQSLFSTKLRLRTGESHSHSTRCHLEAERDAGVYRFWYSYDNRPKAEFSHRSARHEGIAWLELNIDEDRDRLVGQYFTDRRTTGDVKLHRAVTH